MRGWALPHNLKAAGSRCGTGLAGRGRRSGLAAAPRGMQTPLSIGPTVLEILIPSAPSIRRRRRVMLKDGKRGGMGGPA